MRLIDADKLKHHFYVLKYVHSYDIDNAPTIKAIPIDWIQNKYREKWEKDKMRRGDFQFCEVIHDLLEMWDLEKEDWEKEK